MVASNLGCSSGCDNHLLTDLPVAAFYKYTDDIYLFCFEGSVSCIKLSPVDFPVTGGDSLLRFSGEVLEGFCLDVGWTAGRISDPDEVTHFPLPETA